MWLQIRIIIYLLVKGFDMSNKTSIAILLMALAVAGCNRSSNALNVNTQAPPQPLPSVPSGTVASTQLEPISQTTPAETAATTSLDAPSAPQAPTVEATPEITTPVETAALEPTPASNEPLTHEPLAGSWNVASDSSQCRAILAFTKWSGGYRATTLRCNSPELSTVTAWDIKGSKVVLVDSNGSQVASLGAVGTERYAGVTASGQPISFSR